MRSISQSVQILLELNCRGLGFTKASPKCKEHGKATDLAEAAASKRGCVSRGDCPHVWQVFDPVFPNEPQKKLVTMIRNYVVAMIILLVPCLIGIFIIQCGNVYSPTGIRGWDRMRFSSFFKSEMLSMCDDPQFHGMDGIFFDPISVHNRLCFICLLQVGWDRNSWQAVDASQPWAYWHACKMDHWTEGFSHESL